MLESLSFCTRLGWFHCLGCHRGLLERSKCRLYGDCAPGFIRDVSCKSRRWSLSSRSSGTVVRLPVLNHVVVKIKNGKHPHYCNRAELNKSCSL